VRELGLGMTAVLHTWGQNLSRHVHVHCLIPGGALTGTGDWHKAKTPDRHAWSLKAEGWTSSSPQPQNLCAVLSHKLT
jgi:hypothetical protein